MFSEEMEALIEAVLEDGILTDQEKSVLVKRAEKEGIDIDELDVYIQSILQKRHRAEAEKAAEEDRKSKVGNVRRCPACEKPIPIGVAVCPHCGVTINVEDVSSAYSVFAAKVTEMNAEETLIDGWTGGWQKRVRAKANFIQTYPVPNNRLALLDFMSNLKMLSDSTAKPAMRTNFAFSSEPFAFHYWVLFEKCIMMSKKSFLDDPDFQEYFEHYQSELERKKNLGFFSKLRRSFGF